MKIDKSQVSVRNLAGDKFDVADVEAISDTEVLVTINPLNGVVGEPIGIVLDFDPPTEDWCRNLV